METENIPHVASAPVPRGEKILKGFFGIAKSLSANEGGMRSYDLFALTVVTMVAGHITAYIFHGEKWWLVPDLVMLPVFLISVGYNSGRKLSRTLLVAAIFMLCFNWFLRRIFFVDILGMIVLIRFIIDPLMEWAMKSRVRFIGLNMALIPLDIIAENNFQYGTLVLIMAMAGWLNKNLGGLPNQIINSSYYFVFAYVSFLICTDLRFNISTPQFLVTAAGLAWTMYLLYNFRQLLLNSISAKPREPIERICSFIGHKSLEIYVAHIFIFQLIVFYLLIKS